MELGKRLENQSFECYIRESFMTKHSLRMGVAVGRPFTKMCA